MTQPNTNRAVIFVDGSNWFHALKTAGLQGQGQLDYVRVAEKLVAPRTFAQLRWYVGQLSQDGDTELYANQRKFLAQLVAQDQRISVHLGRVEERTATNDAANELLEYLAKLSGRGLRLDPTVYRELFEMGSHHRKAKVWVEKAVDVMLAVDLVVMAERNEYDTAYVLSRDGDFTHAVGFARSKQKKVFAVSNERSSQLGNAVDAFITVDARWFDGCFLPVRDANTNPSASRPSRKAPIAPEVIKKRPR
jgi:uncharacterized LabA/DUF88 family protein